MIITTRKKIFDKFCPLCDHELSSHVVKFTSKMPNLYRIRCIIPRPTGQTCKCNAGFESKVVIEAETTIQSLEEKVRRLRPKRYVK